MPKRPSPEWGFDGVHKRQISPLTQEDIDALAALLGLRDDAGRLPGLAQELDQIATLVLSSVAQRSEHDLEISAAPDLGTEVASNLGHIRAQARREPTRAQRNAALSPDTGQGVR